MVNLLSILLLGLPEIVRRPDLADCLHYIPRKKKVFSVWIRLEWCCKRLALIQEPLFKIKFFKGGNS